MLQKDKWIIMSTQIIINNKTVLKTSPGVFECLYDKFEQIIDENKIKLTPGMCDFMNTMKRYSDGCAFFWVDKLIKSSDDAKILLDILEKSIDDLKKELPDFTIKAIWFFYQALVDYANELVVQGK